VLGNVYRPGLDGLPDPPGQFELDPLLGGSKIGSVDGTVVDGQQVRADALLVQLSDEPPGFLGLGEPFRSAALGPDLSQFHLEVQTCGNDGTGQLGRGGQVLLVFHVRGINGKGSEARFHLVLDEGGHSPDLFFLLHGDMIPVHGKGDFGIPQPFVFRNDEFHERGRGEFRVRKLRLGDFVHDGCPGGHGSQDNALHRKPAANVAGHDHGIVLSGGLNQQLSVHQGDKAVGKPALDVFRTIVGSSS